MSFRLFIYYCALCGGWAACVGWALGRMMAPSGNPLAEAGVKGMFLGLLVALGLGLVDVLWNLSLRQFSQIAGRIGVAVVVGCVGGLMGGMVGYALFSLTKDSTHPDKISILGSIFLILGWTITGSLIGASLGAFDLLARVVRQEDLKGAVRKLRNLAMGGTVGGVLGGLFYVLFTGFWQGIFTNKNFKVLWSPSSTGFVVLGMCIGLLIGLAHVVLKEAWIKVEQGFRAGRELVLSKPVFTIGRAEGVDLGLYGDNAVERSHARIVRQGNDYILTDVGTPGGTYVNDQRVVQPTPLRSGDLIKVGKNILRFGDRQKKKSG